MLGHANASQGRSALVAFVAFVGLCFLSATISVAQVPTQVPFQGRLLDALGAPVNDSVDLDFELFDAIANGTSLWSESHLGVIVVDGIYSVDLGSQTPLTQEILAGGSAFLEITVGGETLVPRQQLLSVPYALVSEEAVGIGGVPAVAFEAIWNSYPFDGGPPANSHPDEGVVDTDADGLPNFLDTDNDNDGLSDIAEVTAGTSINLTTPRIFSVTPTPIAAFLPVTLVVTGVHLGTVTSVGFAGASPTPMNISDTSFSIDVLPETTSSAEPLTITLANGESATQLITVIPDIKTVFASNTTTNGNFGGIAGATAICQADAAAALLSGTFLPWVSESSSSGASSPSLTFTQNVGPYETVLGARVADNWADLTDGTLDSPINLTATGSGAASFQFVWTGTNADGTANANLSDTCNDWTTAAGQGSGGSLTQTDASWTEQGVSSVTCLASFRIYCFEQ